MINPPPKQIFYLNMKLLPPSQFPSPVATILMYHMLNYGIDSMEEIGQNITIQLKISGAQEQLSSLKTSVKMGHMTSIQ